MDDHAEHLLLGLIREGDGLAGRVLAKLGVEVVNLIWRHLATIPGALPWAWGMLRPVYVDGTIATEAVALHEDLELSRVPPPSF